MSTDIRSNIEYLDQIRKIVDKSVMVMSRSGSSGAGPRLVGGRGMSRSVNAGGRSASLRRTLLSSAAGKEVKVPAVLHVASKCRESRFSGRRMRLVKQQSGISVWRSEEWVVWCSDDAVGQLAGRSLGLSQLCLALSWAAAAVLPSGLVSGTRKKVQE